MSSRSTFAAWNPWSRPQHLGRTLTPASHSTVLSVHSLSRGDSAPSEVVLIAGGVFLSSALALFRNHWRCGEQQFQQALNSHSSFRTALVTQRQQCTFRLDSGAKRVLRPPCVPLSNIEADAVRRSRQRRRVGSSWGPKAPRGPQERTGGHYGGSR